MKQKTRENIFGNTSPLHKHISARARSKAGRFLPSYHILNTSLTLLRQRFLTVESSVFFHSCVSTAYHRLITWADVRTGSMLCLNFSSFSLCKHVTAADYVSCDVRNVCYYCNILVLTRCLSVILYPLYYLHCILVLFRVRIYFVLLHSWLHQPCDLLEPSL